MSYQRSAYRGKRQQSSGPTIVTQIGMALKGIWNFIARRQRSKVSWAEFELKFQELEPLLRVGDSVNNSQAVLRADSLLDSVMRQVGGQGSAFADRLRSLESRFHSDGYRSIWGAHKLRNLIAHEHPPVTRSEARQAVDIFRRAANHLVTQ